MRPARNVDDDNVSEDDSSAENDEDQKEFDHEHSRPRHKRRRPCDDDHDAAHTVERDAMFLRQLDGMTTSTLLSSRSQVMESETKQLLHHIMPSSEQYWRRRNWWSAAQTLVAQIQRIVQDTDLTRIQPPVPMYADIPMTLLQLSRQEDARLQVLELSRSQTHLGWCKRWDDNTARFVPTMELQAQLPASMFAPRDYLRFRWLDKRNAVVATVQQSLSHASMTGRWKVSRHSLHGDDERCPYLVLDHAIDKPQQHDAVLTKRRFRVALYFAIDPSWIPPLRLVPNRCNLLNCQHSCYYNNTLTQHDDIDWKTATRPYPHFCETLALVLTWARRRDLLQDDGLDTVHWALIVLYVYRTGGRAQARWPALATLAAVFKLLVETDWLGEATTAINNNNAAVTTAAANTPPPDRHNRLRRTPSQGYQPMRPAGPRAVLVLPQLDCTVAETMQQSSVAQLYAQQTRESPLTGQDPPTLLGLYASSNTGIDGPVLLNASMTHNYLGNVAPYVIRQVQRQARLCLRAWHGGGGGPDAAVVVPRPFACLFAERQQHGFWSACDVYMHVPLQHVDMREKRSVWSESNGGGTDWGNRQHVTRSVVKVLQLALGNRVDGICVLPWQDAVELDLTDTVVLGFKINTEHCARIVDRGPLANDDGEAVTQFCQLWGSKAEIRRFKDGAIVYSVVWEQAGVSVHAQQERDGNFVAPYTNNDKWHGGIVEEILRHILKLHFLKNDAPLPAFALRDMLSLVDSIPNVGKSIHNESFNPVRAHQRIATAFESLATFFQSASQRSVPVPGTVELKSKLGLPLTIDAVEPVSPALRSVELFPPMPHPLLGGPTLVGTIRAAGAVTTRPIEAQICLGGSSNWPNDVKAIGAAKAAMLVQIASGIEELKTSGDKETAAFSGGVCVSPSFLDLCYRGYVFRLFVRADQELKVLRNLQNRNAETEKLLQSLHEKHVVASMHHTMMNGVYTTFPSAPAVVRLLRRWLGAHLLSGVFPLEVVELLVANSYTDPQISLSGAPGSVVSGFLAVLRLLHQHDWLRQPLIVDAHAHISEEDRRSVAKMFEQSRGPRYENGPAMFIVAPYSRLADSSWTSAGCSMLPEWVVLSRAMTLAKRSHDFLVAEVQRNCIDRDRWLATFRETNESFQMYDVMYRVDPDLVVDADASSTCAIMHSTSARNDAMHTLFTSGMHRRVEGPKALQVKLYKNLLLTADDASMGKVLLAWQPVDEVVDMLRSKFGHLGVFLYNEYCPEVIALVWRPDVVKRSRPFSALTSEHAKLTVTEGGMWKMDSLCVVNVQNVLRDIEQYIAEVAVNMRVQHTL